MVIKVAITVAVRWIKAVFMIKVTPTTIIRF
jgi:hypothetical protein